MPPEFPSMISELKGQLTIGKSLHMVVWNPNDDAAEYNLDVSIIASLDENTGQFEVLWQPTSDESVILGCLEPNVLVGLTLEHEEYLFIFYPRLAHVPKINRGAHSVSVIMAFKLDASTTVEVVQRRQHVRIQMRVPVEVTYPNQADIPPIKTWTVNLSGGGIRFTSPHRFPVSSQLLLLLPLISGQPPLKVIAQVVFCDENRKTPDPAHRFGISCKFVELDPVVEKVIVKECFRRELAASAE